MTDNVAVLQSLTKSALKDELNKLDVAHKSTATKQDLIDLLVQERQRRGVNRRGSGSIVLPPPVISPIASTVRRVDDNVFQLGRSAMAAATAALPLSTSLNPTPRGRSPTRRAPAKTLPTATATPTSNASASRGKSKSPVRVATSTATTSAAKKSPPPRPLAVINSHGSSNSIHTMSPANKSLFGYSATTPKTAVHTQIEDVDVDEDDNNNDDVDDDDVLDKTVSARNLVQRTYASRGVSPAATVRRAPTSVSSPAKVAAINARALLSQRWMLWLIGVALLAAGIAWAWNSVDFSEQYVNSYCQSALSTLATRRGAHRCDAKVQFKLPASELIDASVQPPLRDRIVDCIKQGAKEETSATNSTLYSVSESDARPPFLCALQLFAIDNTPTMIGIAVALCLLLGVAWQRSRAQARQRRLRELLTAVYDNLKAQKWNYRVTQDGEPFIAVVHLRDALAKNRADLALWPEVVEAVRANTHVAEKGQLIDGAVSDVFEWVAPLDPNHALPEFRSPARTIAPSFEREPLHQSSPTTTPAKMQSLYPVL